MFHKIPESSSPDKWLSASKEHSPMGQPVSQSASQQVGIKILHFLQKY
jgi:hypothetical protein